MPALARPHPVELDLSDVGKAKQPSSAGVMLPVSIKHSVSGAVAQSPSHFSASTLSPTSAARSALSTWSPAGLTPSDTLGVGQLSSSTPSGMSTTTARQAVISTGQYPPGMGWTPLASHSSRRASFSLAAASPTASLSLVAPSPKNGSTSPTNGITKTRTGLQSILIQEAAFPPGLGFTPVAAATPSLTKSLSFGVPETPLHLERRASLKFEEDGSICKELLLIFRDKDATAQLSAEEAGFIWPQPGWLKAQSSSQEKIQKKGNTQASPPASKTQNAVLPGPSAKPATVATQSQQSLLQSHQPDHTVQQSHGQSVLQAAWSVLQSQQSDRTMQPAVAVKPIAGTAVQHFGKVPQHVIASPVQSIGTQQFPAAGFALTQSIGTQQFPAAAIRSFGTQQFQKHAPPPPPPPPPAQGFAVQSLGSQQMASHIAQQKLIEQMHPNDYWAWQGTETWTPGHEAWMWEQQYYEAHPQSWTGGAASANGAGRGRSKGKGKGQQKRSR